MIGSTIGRDVIKEATRHEQLIHIVIHRTLRGKHSAAKSRNWNEELDHGIYSHYARKPNEDRSQFRAMQDNQGCEKVAKGNLPEDAAHARMRPIRDPGLVVDKAKNEEDGKTSEYLLVYCRSRHTLFQFREQGVGDGHTHDE